MQEMPVAHHIASRLRAPFLLAFLLALILPALPVSLVRAAGTTYYVGTPADDAGTTTAPCAGFTNTTCTLRDALAAATSGQDTISFIPTGVITLTNGTLVLSHSVTIAGPGAHNIAIDGGFNVGTMSGGVRVFLINSGVTATISGLTIQHGNTSGPGGGLGNDGTLTLTNDIIANNNAMSNGGGIVVNGGSVTLLNSVVARNTAGNGGGGGLAVIFGTATVTNTTFIGNTATGGGASIVSQLPLTLTNSTIVSTTVSTGIIAVASTITLVNSILTGPAGSTNCSANAVNEIVDGGHNIQFPGTSCGAGVTTADPLLDPAGLQALGGPVPTIAPLPGSPAIDNVPATGANCPAADARGVSRPQGTACDSGAFESGGFMLTATSGSGQSALSVSGTFAQPLVATVSSASGEPVNGGQVTFTLPAQTGFFDTNNPGTCAISGDTLTAVCPIASGKATSPVLIASFQPGMFNVIASAHGANSTPFPETIVPIFGSISPASGDAKGGSQVTILGGFFTPGATTVTFGTGASAVTVPAGAFTTAGYGTSITFAAPAHAAGVVDVTVTVNGVSTTKTGAYTYGVVKPQPTPEPTRIVAGKPNAIAPTHAPAPTLPAPTPKPSPQPMRH